MALHSKLIDVLGIKYPIIQGPFGGLSTVDLVSTVSNFGALGSYGSHYDAPDKIIRTIDAIRERTSNPFVINLWVSDIESMNSLITKEVFSGERSKLLPFYELLGVEPPTYEESSYIPFEEQIEAALSRKPPVLSFIYGVPSEAILKECRRMHIVTIGTATTVDEALALEGAGLDVIVATGSEAGGHRPAFLEAPEDRMIGTFSLVQQVSRAVSVPVVAAGGIIDGRGVAAACLLGAQGAQLGTAFLACNESGASDYQKKVIRDNRNINTILSRSYSGRLCRFVENEFLKLVPGGLSDTYPIRSWLMRALRKYTNENDITSLHSVSCGQSVGLLEHHEVDSLLESIVADLEQFKTQPMEERG